MLRPAPRVMLLLLLVVSCLPGPAMAAIDYGFGNGGLDNYRNDGHEVLGSTDYGLIEGQCTWFVAAVVPSSQYPWIGVYSGRNAVNWFGRAQSIGMPTGSSPQVNAIMCMSTGSVGHVAVVLAVNGDTVTVGDANWPEDGDVRVHDLSASRADIQGYIYRNGGPPPKVGELSDHNFSQPIIDAYNRHGGQPACGDPWDNGSGTPYVHQFGDGYIQDFHGGSADHGSITLHNGDYHAGYAYFIHGTIWNKWVQYASIFALLGWPTSDEGDCAQSSVTGIVGRYTRFATATINYHPSGAYAGNAYEVHGTIFTKYQAMGYSASPLGLPTSDEFDAASSPFGTTGRLNRFEGGSIYWSASYGAYPVYGQISQQYEAQGGTGSSYGFPTGDPVVSGAMTSQTFEGGTIVVGPQMSVSPTDVVDFGTVQVGQWKELDAYTVTNNGTGTLTGSLPGVGSGTWSVVSGSPFSLTAGQSQVVRVRFCPPSVGTHTCHFWFVTNANSIDGTMQGTAIAALPLAANAGPDQAVAPGGSCTLQGSASGGVPPYTYSWSPSTGLSASNVANPTASPTTITNYTLTVTDSLGQQGSSSATVTVLSCDVNHDGHVNSADAIIVLRYAVDLPLPPGVTPDPNWNAGFAVMILRKAVGLDTVVAAAASRAADWEGPAGIISMPEVSAQPGESVALPVTVTDAEAVAGADITIEYDAAALTDVQVEAGAGAEGRLFVQNVADGQVKVSLAGASEQASVGDTWFTIRAKVRADAKPGTFSSLSFSGAEAYSESGHANPLAAQDGVVKIEEPGHTVIPGPPPAPGRPGGSAGAAPAPVLTPVAPLTGVLPPTVGQNRTTNAPSPATGGMLNAAASAAPSPPSAGGQVASGTTAGQLIGSTLAPLDAGAATQDSPAIDGQTAPALRQDASDGERKRETSQAKEIADVPKSSPDLPCIQALVDAGVMALADVEKRLFKPQAAVTRRELAEALCQAAGWSPLFVATPTFADVGKDHPASRWIERLAEKGVVTATGAPGPGARQFRPDATATRGEVAELLCRAKGWESRPHETSVFADVTAADALRGFIERLYDEGDVKGDGAKALNYRPTAGCTRAELAVLVCRGYNLERHRTVEWDRGSR